MDRAEVRRVITDAYYETRNEGGTMETAADRAADAVMDLYLVDRPDHPDHPDKRARARTGYVPATTDCNRPGCPVDGKHGHPAINPHLEEQPT